MFNKFKAYFVHDVNKILDQFDKVINKLEASATFHKAQADEARLKAAIHDGFYARAKAVAARFEGLIH